MSKLNYLFGWALYSDKSKRNMKDVLVSDLLPYRIFKAFISVVDNTQPVDYALTVGKKYVITSLVEGDDFTNVGFEEVGKMFIATGTTPAIATVSTIFELHEPVMNIITNLLGGNVIAETDYRDNINAIKITSNGLFPVGKTTVLTYGTNIKTLAEDPVNSNELIFLSSYQDITSSNRKSSWVEIQVWK